MEWGFFVLQVYKGMRGELRGAIWSTQPQKVVFAFPCVCDRYRTCREGGRLLTRHKLEKEVSVVVGGGLKGMPSFFRCEYPCILFLVISVTVF